MTKYSNKQRADDIVDVSLKVGGRLLMLYIKVALFVLFGMWIFMMFGLALITWSRL